MTDTIINLETINPIEFFGVNNGKLDLLKKKFPLLKILSRGTQLKLSGSPEQIDSAREKIGQIVSYLERNGHMSQQYFEQVLGGDDQEVIDHFQEKNPAEVLVFGPNGKSVRARTANQKKLVQEAEQNDIVFAIGPAGTGKTYTAVALAVRALKNKQVKKIILTRPAVEAGESLGFLPGDLKEKIDPHSHHRDRPLGLYAWTHARQCLYYFGRSPKFHRSATENVFNAHRSQRQSHHHRRYDTGGPSA